MIGILYRKKRTYRSFDRKNFPSCLNPLDLLFDKVKIISILDIKKG